MAKSGKYDAVVAIGTVVSLVFLTCWLQEPIQFVHPDISHIMDAVLLTCYCTKKRQQLSANMQCAQGHLSHIFACKQQPLDHQAQALYKHYRYCQLHQLQMQDKVQFKV